MGALQVVRSMKADSVERIERDLATLDARGVELANEIERLTGREDEIEDDGELLATIAAGRTARNRLRKLDAQIVETRQRLDLARNAARAKIRIELLAEFEPAARAYVVAGLSAQRALERLTAAREAVRAAGFDLDYNSLPVPPNINGAAFLPADLLAAFEAALSPARRTAFAAAQPQAAKRQPASEPLPGYGARPAIGGFWGGPALQDTPLARRAPRRETAAEGERLFQIHRGTLDHPRCGQMQAGDVVAMTADEACALIRNGVGDFVTPEEVSALYTITGGVAKKEVAQ